MKGRSCLAHMQGMREALSESEKRVADYILENYLQVLDYTVKELSEKAKVSDATVIRFCRSIGYKGYQDLKINLARDAIVPYKHLNVSLEKDDTPEQIVTKVFQSETEAIQETLQILDIRTLVNVANAIRGARKVVLFGSGGSALVAVDAMHKMLKIGIHCVAHVDADIQAMESALMNAEDVALGISHSGTNRNVIECLKNAKANGACTIGLTTRGKTPVHRLCDYILMTSAKETVFKSESAAGRIAQLSVIDSLVSVLSFMDYDGAFDAIQKTRSATAARKY